MRIWLIYLAFLGFGLLPFTVVFYLAPSPDRIIIGEWKEMAWEYERVNKTDDDSIQYKVIPEDVKKSIGQDLIIHQAEKWRFHPNGRLVLSGANQQNSVRWRIKGRGHILQIRYRNNVTEYYNLTKLDDNEMVLNFETDVQARGIAKLTFKKL